MYADSIQRLAQTLLLFSGEEREGKLLRIRKRGEGALLSYFPPHQEAIKQGNAMGSLLRKYARGRKSPFYRIPMPNLASLFTLGRCDTRRRGNTRAAVALVGV
jgi:hypothetical protein